MSNIATQRIKREFKEANKSEDNLESIKIEMVCDSLTELKGQISGPPDTPYEGGNFNLKIEIPDAYPFKPPLVQFITKIWHPNISSVTGTICLDVLKDEWIAAMTLRTALLSVQALLSSAEADDPQDAMVAKQYKQRPDIFDLTAKHWTNVYAGGPHICKDCDDKVRRMGEMGVSNEPARSILSCCDWDFERAVDQLFG